MKYMRVVFALAMVPLVIGGCVVPQPSANNSITLHNQSGSAITYFSVVRTGDIGGAERTIGVNLLEEPLASGESFTVGGLLDGTYYLYLKRSSTYHYCASATQSIEGGKNYDWYFTEWKAGKIGSFFCESPLTTQQILDAILGEHGNH